jgi:hypothetical protein
MYVADMELWVTYQVIRYFVHVPGHSTEGHNGCDILCTDATRCKLVIAVAAGQYH